ncbi:GGDEF domain-containing protein [Clostridium beijerinckii]|uniref:Diguanylate cyclase (GGDEF)-like protein n=3 Tax=Clostridium beijerinckii TaxID=1520 RepID=A0A9Q5CVZ6_CLOBE|nr:GGDEF domain-containing protein [Clostridium beijerinckii]AQS05573.1 putative diguanylate cyclase YcdT [Clostridium beijerinckii]MBA2884919.1 diguanylate cyclase (GGDEF)-like protein [Clostridium beijerinckii]MBA2899708.1 diguanylate cyclase (GGDEF)-like protein [Clostridium beijerinckii]MBA2909270.1 diguanylate cyclase (GGDEF)-like protein [Clostridium beijerinckii]MBA9014842.1 diguanylate cyclase (GGDEF)-like protein [Clostridium beijerinckii]
MAIFSPVQVNIVLFILLLILFGHTYFNMNRKNITNRLFMWIMGLTAFAIMLEILSVILNNPNLKQFMVMQKIVNVLGFSVTPIIPFLGYIFSKEWVNRYQKDKIKLNKILLLPLLINGIMAFVSYSVNLLFYVTSENTYERGPLFFILPCVSYFYFGYNLYFIYKQRKRFSWWELRIFNLFYIAAGVFTGIQIVYSSYLTIWNGTAMMIVIIYIFILNDQVHRDRLTGLENYSSYERYIENISFKKINKLFIINIDIDDFKSVNDKFGHNEGDEALKMFANLLIESFSLRRKKLIRVGGDEFLILLEVERKEIVDNYIQNLNKNIEAYNKTKEKPYELKFSYGVACCSNTKEDIHDILKCADKLMYEQKKSRKMKL